MKHRVLAVRAMAWDRHGLKCCDANSENSCSRHPRLKATLTPMLVVRDPHLKVAMPQSRVLVQVSQRHALVPGRGNSGQVSSTEPCTFGTVTYRRWRILR